MIRSASGLIVPAPPSSYAAAVLADSPVLYWRLGDSSGPVADSGSGSHAGTLGSGATLGAAGLLVGDSNTALAMDGTANAHLSTPDAADLNPTTSWAVELWWAGTSMGGVYPKLAWKPVTASVGKATYVLQGTSSGTVQLRTTIGGTNYTTAASAALTDGNPHHIVGERNGTALNLYIDGSLSQTLTIPATASNTASNNFTCGYTASPYDYLDGVLDEVALYGAALGATRIAAHHNAGI